MARRLRTLGRRVSTIRYSGRLWFNGQPAEYKGDELFEKTFDIPSCGLIQIDGEVLDIDLNNLNFEYNTILRNGYWHLLATHFQHSSTTFNIKAALTETQFSNAVKKYKGLTNEDGGLPSSTLEICREIQIFG